MREPARQGRRASGQRPGQVSRAQLYLMTGLSLAVRLSVTLRRCRAAARTLDTMHTMKPFSSMLYDSTVFASCRILPISPHQPVSHGESATARTRVDQLLLGHLPALLRLNLRLELANLSAQLAAARRSMGSSAYRFRRLGLDDELVLLEILRSW